MESQTIGFLLIAIKTEQFATFPENFSDKKNSNLTTALEFKINKENQQVAVFATFTFEQTKKPFIKIETSCHFSIAPKSWEEFQDEEKITFPRSFMSHLTMLAVGTSRGILHCKTEGTEFSKFILPTLNVEEMVNKDAVFRID